MAFEANPSSGNNFVMDSHPDYGGQGLGPSPVEALLGSLAACSAMDVLSVLQKKRQNVTEYRIEVDGDRIPPGEWPRPFTKLRVKHVIKGENLDPVAVERAVQLSDEKYCTVLATLRGQPEITSEWTIET
ncbi:MAG: OsmC family protein [Fimbriimonadaceae bacterium]|nr:OsmC family protein [Fimbriimonadaceae bacterium]